MTRFLPLVAVVGLAACEPMPIEPGTRVLPAEVQALLLPGVPDTVAIQDGQGCYIISNEITAPRQGYFLRDAVTNEPLCYDREGMRIPYVAPVVAEVPAEEAAT